MCSKRDLAAMRVFAVRPDEDLRRRLDEHLARAGDRGGPSDNELLCTLLERGLATAPDKTHTGEETVASVAAPDASSGTHGTQPSRPSRAKRRGDGPVDEPTELDAGPATGRAVAPHVAEERGSGSDPDGDDARTAEGDDCADPASDIGERVGDVVDALYDR